MTSPARQRHEAFKTGTGYYAPERAEAATAHVVALKHAMQAAKAEERKRREVARREAARAAARAAKPKPRRRKKQRAKTVYNRLLWNRAAAQLEHVRGEALGCTAVVNAVAYARELLRGGRKPHRSMGYACKWFGLARDVFASAVLNMKGAV